MEYFKCERDCGVFVAMDKLSEPQNSNAKASYAHKVVQPHPSHPLQAQDGPLQLGDMVTFFTENEKPVNGVVRWIGRNISVLKNGSQIVGLETVSYVYEY